VLILRSVGGAPNLASKPHFAPYGQPDRPPLNPGLSAGLIALSRSVTSAMNKLYALRPRFRGGRHKNIDRPGVATHGSLP
jgi:hypothetical protein